MAFSGNKDTDYLILANLDDRSLFSFCLADKSINKLCKNEIFWRNRFFSRFGDKAAEYKPENRSWRNHYLKVVSDLDLSNHWDFFQDISWQIDLNPKFKSSVRSVGEKFARLDRSDERIQNRYWLLELGQDITIDYPVDRYGDLDYVRRRYVQKTHFTPAQVLKLVYNFYEEDVTEEHVEEMEELDEDIFLEAVENVIEGEKLKYIDLMDGLTFFEGFNFYDDFLHVLALGS
tara:strand:- start:1815 stop:2510 length:696 start_codon:yes stop_codon:yes gene_type:complete